MLGALALSALLVEQRLYLYFRFQTFSISSHQITLKKAINEAEFNRTGC